MEVIGTIFTLIHHPFESECVLSCIYGGVKNEKWIAVNAVVFLGLIMRNCSRKERKAMKSEKEKK